MQAWATAAAPSVSAYLRTYEAHALKEAVCVRVCVRGGCHLPNSSTRFL